MLHTIIHASEKESNGPLPTENGRFPSFLRRVSDTKQLAGSDIEVLITAGFGSTLDLIRRMGSQVAGCDGNWSLFVLGIHV